MTGKVIGLSPRENGLLADFSRVECPIRGHDFQLESDRFFPIGKCFVVCTRCGEAHLLENIHCEVEAFLYKSRHFDPVVGIAPWMIMILSGLTLGIFLGFWI